MRISNIIDSTIRPIRVISTRIFGKKVLSDFRWSSYTDFDYEPQLSSILASGNELILSEKQCENLLARNTSEGNDGVMGSHFQLYRTCLELNPSSVLEVGAGAGYHLINLKKLLPQARVSGIDLLETQIELGKRIFPEFIDQLEMISIGDFAAKSLSKNLRVNSDLVFCQAVTMHLPLKSARQMIKNMIDVSNRFVLLVDNLTVTHNYEKLMQEILDEVGGFSFEITQIDKHPFGMVKIVKEEDSRV